MEQISPPSTYKTVPFHKHSNKLTFKLSLFLFLQNSTTFHHRSHSLFSFLSPRHSPLTPFSSSPTPLSPKSKHGSITRASTPSILDANKPSETLIVYYFTQSLFFSK
ncbi:uncharacterized protein DS421_8g243920 [Arachis hypogaea]|nr:uncharacterized protein DS421_8g243920 [Arachis hypogaea]